MNNEAWSCHISAWESYLLACITATEDNGEKTKARRQLETIERIRYAAVLNPGIISEFIAPSKSNPGIDTSLRFTVDLNESQKNAVSGALSGNIISFIQGPPGTGKTQVIAEICMQLYSRDPNVRILICSETHTAVNNLLARISKYRKDIRILRIRDKDGDESVDNFAVKSIVADYLKWAEQNIQNNVAVEIIKEMMTNTEDKSLEKVLALSATIVGMTCNRIMAYNLKEPVEMFDYVIIDEVCKATLPEILAPLTIAHKGILLGDPKQLPPVFCSEERDVIKHIESCNLDRFMYIDELFENSPSVSRLDTQYRMAPLIGNMVSQLFYEGALKNGRDDGNMGSLLWIDYQPSQVWPPKTEAEKVHPMVYNEDECKIIADILEGELSSTTRETTFGVIAPYRGQVQILRKICPKTDNVQIDTVDAFQGKECDTIIFSATRTSGTFRFLTDIRRLNVALSRAKDKLIIVGNLSYCKKSPILNAISCYCQVKTIND